MYIKWKKHSTFRALERIALTKEEIEDLFKRDLYIFLGYERKSIGHFCFYSISDKEHYVLVIDVDCGEAITLLAMKHCSRMHYTLESLLFIKDKTIEFFSSAPVSPIPPIENILIAEEVSTEEEKPKEKKKKKKKKAKIIVPETIPEKVKKKKEKILKIENNLENEYNSKVDTSIMNILLSSQRSSFDLKFIIANFIKKTSYKLGVDYNTTNPHYIQLYIMQRIQSFLEEATVFYPKKDIIVCVYTNTTKRIIVYPKDLELDKLQTELNDII